MTNSAAAAVTKNPVATWQHCLTGVTADGANITAGMTTDRSPVEPSANVAAQAANVPAAVSDKKKDDEQNQRFSSSTSPQRSILQPIKHTNTTTHTHNATRRRSSSTENQKLITSSGASEAENKNPSGSTTTKSSCSTAQKGASPTTPKKMIPCVSVSMKQNLSELHYNGGILAAGPNGTVANSNSNNTNDGTPNTTGIRNRASKTASHRSNGKTARSQTTDLSTLASFDAVKQDTGSVDCSPTPRLRSSTLRLDRPRKSSLTDLATGKCKENVLDLSPVQKAKPDLFARQSEDRDKSSKRKSNLNRALNEEATQDGDDALAASRRRRRRELGMSRPLIPTDDVAVREFISEPQKTISTSTFIISSDRPPRGDLAMHMDNARRGVDADKLLTTERRRAQTTSPKLELARMKQEAKSGNGSRVSRRSDTLPLGGSDPRKQRSNDVNRKVNERTKTGLAEIIKIVEMANEAAVVPTKTSISSETMSDYDFDNSKSSTDAFLSLNTSMNRIRASHERELILFGGLEASDLPAEAEAAATTTITTQPTPITTTAAINPIYPTSFSLPKQPLETSPAKHATFLKEELIYYEPDAIEDEFPIELRASSSTNLLRQRLLKARSVERDTGHDSPKLSPILRRKSTDEPTTSTSTGVSTLPGTSAQNHIVSILKKKDHIAGESSSASSNASPVTFSSTVVDTPRHKRAGILKKRSSLDESRYYSRSHSPDERSILVKSARRNSLEEMAAASSRQQHGILKQSSYDSNKSDGCPSVTEAHPQSILKKKDSTSTPSDGGAHGGKHVSISQAVILAAAELDRRSADNPDVNYDEGTTPSNEEYGIRPILKTESASSDEAPRPPKPILKKKSSGDSDEHEIRPILKTSRKSSREEFEASGAHSDDGARHFSEPCVRPILKTESPSKRRSLGDSEAEGEDEDTGLSPTLFKRRTRSLERHEPPVVNLAAALNAISTAQASASQPSTTQPLVSQPSVSQPSLSQPSTSQLSTEQVSTPPVVTVAERVKNMEMFLSSATRAPRSATNTSWESASGAVPKMPKPSVARRDMYRERFKTQPVTDDEKSFFKATTSFETPTTFAFTPVHHSVDALNYATIAAHQQQQRQLQLTTSNDSTVNSNATYTLARSQSQSLPYPTQYLPQPATPLLLAQAQPHQVSAATSIQKVAKPSAQHPRPGSPPLTPYGKFGGRSRFSNRRVLSYGDARGFIGDYDDDEEEEDEDDDENEENIDDIDDIEDYDNNEGTEEFDTTISLSGQYNTHSLGSESERIFEMSGIDDPNKTCDASGGEPKAEAGDAAADSSGDAILRSKSVRARATLFQQLHGEKPTEREERASFKRRTTPTMATPPATSRPTQNNENNEKLPTTSAATSSTVPDGDEEIEPSSLPMSERLRFFAEIANRSNNLNSFQRSFSICKDRSTGGTVNTFHSANASLNSSDSASVTPTPLDCSNPIASPLDITTTSVQDGPATPSPPDAKDQNEDDYSLSKSNSIVMTCIQEFEAKPKYMNASPPSMAFATTVVNRDGDSANMKPIRLKTMGKMILPQTLYFNDRNNNNESSDMNIPSVKKIGKIKSPFIDCQQWTHNQEVQSKCIKLDAKSSPHTMPFNSFESAEPGTISSDNNASSRQGDISSNGNSRNSGHENTHVHVEQRQQEQKECDTNATPPTRAVIDDDAPQSLPVNEIRKRFNRIVGNIGVSQAANHSPQTQSLPPMSQPTESAISSDTPENRPPANSDDQRAKYAKYFGLTETEFSNTTKVTSSTPLSSHNAVVATRMESHNSDKDEVMHDVSAQHAEPANSGAGSVASAPKPPEPPQNRPLPTPEQDRQVKHAKYFGITDNEFRSANQMPNASPLISRNVSRNNVKTASEPPKSTREQLMHDIRAFHTEGGQLNRKLKIRKPTLEAFRSRPSHPAGDEAKKVQFTKCFGVSATEFSKINQFKYPTPPPSSEDSRTKLKANGESCRMNDNNMAQLMAELNAIEDGEADVESNASTPVASHAAINRNLRITEKLRMLAASTPLDQNDTPNVVAAAHRRREIMKRRTLVAVSSNSSVESMGPVAKSTIKRSSRIGGVSRRANVPVAAFNAGINHATATAALAERVNKFAASIREQEDVGNAPTNANRPNASNRLADPHFSEISDYDDIFLTEEELRGADNQFNITFPNL